jgi:hypothetical protein
MCWARRFPVLLITANCCDVDWYGLELRFKKNIDDAWDCDEIVGRTLRQAQGAYSSTGSGGEILLLG